MDIFEIAQVSYYLIVSFAVLVLGAMLAILVYRLIRIAGHLQSVSERLDGAAHKLDGALGNIIVKLSALPLFSYFARQSKAREETSPKNRKYRRGKGEE